MFSLLSEKEPCESKARAKSKDENGELNKEDNEHISPLKIELTEIRERYLEMSLKYAEVEAQREQLVLKLKSLSKGKSWFS